MSIIKKDHLSVIILKTVKWLLCLPWYWKRITMQMKITFTQSGLHCSARLVWSFPLFLGHPVYIHKFKLWNTVIFFFPEIPGIYIHIQYVYIIHYKCKLRWNSCSCYTYTYCIYIFKTLCILIRSLVYTICIYLTI